MSGLVDALEIAAIAAYVLLAASGDWKPAAIVAIWLAAGIALRLRRHE